MLNSFKIRTLLIGLMVTIFVTPGAAFFAVDPSLKPHTAGPNCWDAALYAVGATKALRFMHPDEFIYLVDNYCVETQTPKLGDLGRMYDEKEVHAFIYLDESTIYSKHSNDADESYRIMSFEQMLHSYYVKRECALDKNKDVSCFRKTSYYRCHPKMDQIQIEMQILKPVENLIYQLIFSKETKFEHKSTCQSEEFKNRNIILAQINQQLIELKKIKHYDLKYLKYWIESIKMQIYDSQVNSGYFRCKGVSYEDKYIDYNNVYSTLKSFNEL